MRPTVQIVGLDAHNLRALMEDMEYGPKWYSTTELYVWYTDMVRKMDMEPVSQREFANSLKRLGYRAVVKRQLGGPTARGWFISRRAWRA